MLYYNNDDTKANEKDTSNEENVEAKASPMGFKSQAQERMWMDQVQRECAKGYANRMR